MANLRDKPAPDEDLAQMILGVGPCTYLLLLLIGLISAFPYLEEGLLGRTALGILFSSVLLVGAFATPPKQRVFYLKLALALLGIILQWTALWTANLTTLKIAGITYATSLIISIAAVLRYVLKRGQITADKLHGALAGYIMIAFAWAFIYALTEITATSSFGPGRLDFTQPGTLFKLIYFSFTTLTTTGYGDIVPLTNHARSMVMIEEFTGVFYVGVLIARLAGLYPSNSTT